MVTSPEANRSFSTSTSVVTRVTSLPDRIFVEIRDVQCLQVRDELAAQIEHRALASPLHQVRLTEIEKESRNHHAEIQQTQLRESRPGVMRKPVVQQWENVGVLRGYQVAVDRQFRKQRSGDLKGGIDKQQR